MKNQIDDREKNAAETSANETNEVNETICKAAIDKSNENASETAVNDATGNAVNDEATASDGYEIKNSADGNPFGMTVSSDKPKTPSGAWKKFVAILKYIFIDGLSGMALGLFATLIIGTIIGKIGSIIGGTIGGYIVIAGKFAQFMMGAGIALGMGYKLKKAPLVAISAAVVGMLASFAGKISAEYRLMISALLINELEMTNSTGNIATPASKAKNM